MNVKFSLEQKASAFDRIANEYYNANFGQLSKSDMELLMFDIYISNVINNPKYDNGTIDYNECSDYKISKDLGITQQRVNNLKIKKQLRYPIDFDWKASLAGLMKNARYDKNAQKISLNIPDPNLFLEIQNFLEEKGAFIDIQLNRKILQMRAEYFVELSLLLETEKKRKEVIKKIKEILEDPEKENAVFEEKNIGKTLISYATDISTVIKTISNVISPENIIFRALTSII